MDTHIKNQVLQKRLSSFHYKAFPFSPSVSGHHLISLHRLIRDRVSKLGNVVSTLTLWNECTRQREVSWNVGFCVLSPDISLFAIFFKGLQNIPFSVLQEQCSNTVLRAKRCNSLVERTPSHGGFSDSFSPVFIWWYFQFPHKLKVPLNVISRICPWRSFKTA